MAEFIPFTGCYRRLIDLRTWDENTVVGWLEDDYHHFGLTLTHDGRLVTDVRVAAVRYPWTTCPPSREKLKGVIGKPLLARCTDIGSQIDMRQQCTHLFDLVGLVSAHAFHRREHHRYHAAVHVIDDDKSKVEWMAAKLWRDEQVVMSWELHRGVIMTPPVHAGNSMNKGFRTWTEALDETTAEQASVLRRAVFVSPARTYRERVGSISHASTTPAVCHTYQPENRIVAVRDGDASDVHLFDTGPEGMLALVATKPE